MAHFKSAPAEETQRSFINCWANFEKALNAASVTNSQELASVPEQRFYVTTDNCCYLPNMSCVVA